MKKLLNEHKAILIVLLGLFLVRILALKQLGIEYSLASDDLSYVLSGIEFKNTGKITMHGVISAQIMPGMPIIIGIISFIFGQDQLLWLALKIIWIVMGCMSAFIAYKCAKIFVPKKFALIAPILFFRPDYIWMDNLILTETPFLLSFLSMVYCTLMMGKTQEKKYFWLCLVSYMSALMFKANIGIYPLFAFVYLILVKYDFMTLIKQGLIIALVLLSFIIPWSIRNYKIYDTFIPLTYGAGNPTLLGTYQGIDYPTDESLDYKTNVDDVVIEKYNKYYEEDGTIKDPAIQRYIALEADGVKAKYRMDVWKKENPLSMILSYLVLKPKYMIESSFYWNEVFSINKSIVDIIHSIVLTLFSACILISFIMKEKRSEMIFLLLLYIGNILIYSMTFSFDRYVATLTPLMFIGIAIGISLIFELSKKIRA